MIHAFHRLHPFPLETVVDLVTSGTVDQILNLEPIGATTFPVFPGLNLEICSTAPLEGGDVVSLSPWNRQKPSSGPTRNPGWTGGASLSQLRTELLIFTNSDIKRV